MVEERVVFRFLTKGTASFGRSFVSIGRAIRGVGRGIGGISLPFVKLFRALARLRTAFFILVTFLALRPLLRFVKDLGEVNAGVQRTFQGISTAFDQFRGKLAAAFEPVIAVLGAEVIGFFNMLREKLADLDPRLIAEFVVFAKTGFKLVEAAVHGVFLGITALVGLMRQLPFILVNLVKGMEEWSTVASAIMGPYSILVIRKTKEEWIALRTAIWDAFDVAPHEQLKGADVFGAALEKQFDEFTKSMRLAMKSTGASIDEEMIAKIEKMIKLLKEPLTTGFFESWGAAIERFSAGLQQAEHTFNTLSHALGVAIRGAMEAGLSDTLVNAFEGRVDRMKDAMISFLRSINRAVADFVAKMVVQEYVLEGLKVLGGALSGALGHLLPGSPADVPASPAYLNATRPWGPHPEPLPPGGGGPGGVPPWNPNSPLHKAGGGTSTVVNIHAIDAQSFQQLLRANRTVITEVVEAALTGSSPGIRQAVRSVK